MSPSTPSRVLASAAPDIEIECRRDQSGDVDSVPSNTDVSTLIAHDERQGKQPNLDEQGSFHVRRRSQSRVEKISDTAKSATDKVKAAGERTRDQLEADVAAARAKTVAAADRIKDKADAPRDNASSDWQEIRDTWAAHVAKVRKRAHEKKNQIDAHNAAVDADMAEAYAYDAIDFALDAIEEAEYAVLEAIYTRADAEALKV